MRRLIALLVLAGCASMAAIPGGPEDHTPPVVVRITPDTQAVNFHGDAVDFKFDGVVNDQSGPTRDLNGLFLISPRDGAPRIYWHRDHIGVRPKGKWLPNTAYTVTLLPGLSDLSNNVMTKSASVTFSTGPTMPPYGVLGRVFDWVAQKVAPNAVVEAIQRPDSVVYFGLADSTGQFHLGPFGAGTYTVIAFIDKNKNLERDPGELWDSVQVKIDRTQPYLEMLAAQRDTLGPRIATIAADDSVTLRVTLDKPLSPTVPIDTSRFSVRTADSVHLSMLWAESLQQYQAEVAKEHADSARVADSLAAIRDTTKRAKPAPPPAPPVKTEPAPPKPSQPAPPSVVIIRLALGSHLLPLKQYRVTATDLVNLLGYKGSSSRVFATPKAPEAPVKPDSTKGAARPDSAALKRPPPKRAGGGRGGGSGAP